MIDIAQELFVITKLSIVKFHTNWLYLLRLNKTHQYTFSYYNNVNINFL